MAGRRRSSSAHHGEGEPSFGCVPCIACMMGVWRKVGFKLRSEVDVGVTHVVHKEDVLRCARYVYSACGLTEDFASDELG